MLPPDKTSFCCFHRLVSVFSLITLRTLVFVWKEHVESLWKLVLSLQQLPVHLSQKLQTIWIFLHSTTRLEKSLNPTYGGFNMYYFCSSLYFLILWFTETYKPLQIIAINVAKTYMNCTFIVLLPPTVLSVNHGSQICSGGLTNPDSEAGERSKYFETWEVIWSHKVFLLAAYQV